MRISAAETWLAGNIHHGWASCPLTQNGCVRILSQPAYPNTLSVADAVMRLRTAISGPYHRFLADSVSLLDDAVVDCRRVSRPRQLTDVYLLALAVGGNPIASVPTIKGTPARCKALVTFFVKSV